MNSNRMSQANKRPTAKYVYDLPYYERKKLCQILDINNKWEELGGMHMNIDHLELLSLRRMSSPTDELLTLWGQGNHTVRQLFVLLSRMQHYQAMMVLRDFVDDDCKRLLDEGEENMEKLLYTRGNHSRHGNPGPSHQASCSQRYPDYNLNAASINKVQDKMERRPLEPEGKILNKIVNNSSNSSENANNAQTVAMNSNQNQRQENQENRSPIDKKQNTDQGAVNPRHINNFSDLAAIEQTTGCVPNFSFDELELATNNWNQNSILGRGGFGTVYKAKIRDTLYAIKRTKSQISGDINSTQIQQLLQELKTLNSYRHDNILALYGYSVKEDDFCLIYQYMSNGSLEDRLQCKQFTKPLTWNRRLLIVTGVARGLRFLHRNPGEKSIIHGDIKSANILLDSNFEPKIGDFGMAKEGPNNLYTHISKVHGTRPYLPDEFLRSKKFSTKVDVHCFGIVLFEVVSGLRAYDERRSKKFLKEHVLSCAPTELIDKKGGYDSLNVFDLLYKWGKACVSHLVNDRPDMVLVLQVFQEKVEFIKNTTTDFQKALLNNDGSCPPSTPLDIQMFYDHMQHFPHDDVTRRVNSPLPPSIYLQQRTGSIPIPSYNLAASPNQNPFLLPPTVEVSKSGKQDADPGRRSPYRMGVNYANIPLVVNEQLNVYRRPVVPHFPQTIPPTHEPNAINVSPPSGSSPLQKNVNDKNGSPKEMGIRQEQSAVDKSMISPDITALLGSAENDGKNNLESENDTVSTVGNIPLLSVLEATQENKQSESNQNSSNSSSNSSSNRSSYSEEITNNEPEANDQPVEEETPVPRKEKKLWILVD